MLSAQLLSCNVTWYLVASDPAMKSAADSSPKKTHFVDATQLLADKSQLFCDIPAEQSFCGIRTERSYRGIAGDSTQILLKTPVGTQYRSFVQIKSLWRERSSRANSPQNGYLLFLAPKMTS